MKRKPDDLFKIGVITSPHGVRGEVNVFPTTDDVTRFNDLKEVLIKKKSGMESYGIDGVKYHKNMVILKFKGVDDRNTVETWRKYELYVTRENAVKLEEGEYFIADLIGLDVYEESGERLGELYDVLQTAANDVYVVKTDNGEEILIPVIKDCILNVDIDGGRVDVHLLPGLRELNEKK
ncbi:MAG: ribosome maturation factor RimM [Lachnospiraceae bacterium]|nr:ribosome maturation factor RimM [Lachnospiraceae bacterium]